MCCLLLSSISRKYETFKINSTSGNKSPTFTSYLVALRVAKESMPHTITENLILPAAIDMVNIMIDAEEANKLKTIPLSNDTISRRINEMSTDVLNQIFDESIDVTNLAQFLCFVRYECDGTIKENMLFCKSIPGHTTGQGLFELFIETTKNENLDWNKCISVYSDGAKAITGKNSGLIVKLKELMPHIEWTHCFLHRHALAAKKNAR
ncbi:protein FAM200A-like [Sipha flava]|uniref:Protein FAM200A-like n=1 Tax=Sipha flava TaxID=143950 RepID=A0A8B8G654_9HEMI|nr:protein FAM200A-like [Sipha flava]